MSAVPIEEDSASGQPGPRLFVMAWIVACIILLSAYAAAIRTLDFPDPDDIMRLLEVRDWLGGQSWFDVSHHRMNPPFGGDMHWSRLVDLPIAAVILLLRPFVSPESAELGALVAVPLLTLGVVMALVARLTTRLIDRRHALLACFMLPILAAVFTQLRPLRIDHHGWQMALGVGLAVAVIDRNRLRSGVAAGIVAALWLNISLEGLPFIAAAMALLAVRWIIDPREGPRLAAAVGTLACASFVLYAATRAPGDWSMIHCDAVSPGYLALLAVGAIGSVGAIALPFRTLEGTDIRAVAARAGLLGLVGAAALAALFWVAPACSGGPFVALDPLVRDIWYDNVREGLPIWRQSTGVAIHVIGVPLVGLVGTFLCWRRARDDGAGEARTRWGKMLFLLAAATLTAIAVQRAGGLANLLALPGAVWLFRAAITAALKLRSAPRKAVALAASLSMLFPGQVVTAGTRALAVGEEQESLTGSCASHDQLVPLDALPAATIVAPLDIAPSFLEATHHRVVATGHHRNADAMLDVIHVFTLPPDQAHQIVSRRGATLIAICPAFNEMDVYAGSYPAGLWAQMAAGHAPAWLQPVPIAGVGALRVWRVVG